jgi:hypothetical protein
LKIKNTDGGGIDPRVSSRMSKIAAASGPASIHDVPDDLLRLILLRLDSVWLARAALTCKRWRGIVGGAAFLRLSRALHPPAIAGHYHLCAETKEFIPSSMPPPIDSSRFSSFDFLPGFGDKDKTWWVADCYGGLVLLCQLGKCFKRSKLFVCDPLARLCRRIHHPERNVFDPNLYYSTDLSHGDAATLIDGEADGGGISLSNFRILYRLGHEHGVIGYVFSTADEGRGGWPWRNLNTEQAADWNGNFFTMGHLAARVDGSLFLGLKGGILMALDKDCMDFSEIDLPTFTDPSDPDNCSSFRVVHSSGDGTEPQTVRVVHVNGEDLEVFRRVNDGWVLEHRIPRLSEATRYLLPGYRGKENDCDWNVEAVGDGPGFVVLSAHKKLSAPYYRERLLVFSRQLGDDGDGGSG